MTDLQYDLAHEGTWTIPGTSTTVPHEGCDHDNHSCTPQSADLAQWETDGGQMDWRYGVVPNTSVHCGNECVICDMEAGE